MSLAENRKRARSEDEKEARKAAILAAAREMIAESGFDGVTMSGLAGRAGLAKGTLYLYARTKEELFLALFCAAMDAFVARIEAIDAPDRIVEEMTGAALEVPLFLPLFARLVAVIEANVADGPLFAAKRALAGHNARVAAHLGALLDLPPARGAEVTATLVLALQGAAQFDISARRDLAQVPEDLRPMIAGHGFAQSFPPAARLILSAVR
ncbi:MAG: helix-turn-helix transcriptional regulator [Maritimibacter sp.]|nr:helix-turn-helix transcriptional regulator [Maritimibacter sp.]